MDALMSECEETTNLTDFELSDDRIVLLKSSLQYE